MSLPIPTASKPPTMATTHDSHDSSFSSSSSQDSNPDTSSMSFESSFRLDSTYPNHNAECEKHPKGKRKRTTTQDKAILEAAYNSNPKPDKAARLEIVKRVTLNEKEVQIWFQNRRQNDRRKSRPLSPQEIEALRYGGGMKIVSSEAVPAPMDPAIAAPRLNNDSEKAQRQSAEARVVAEPENPSAVSQEAAPQQVSQPASPKSEQIYHFVAENPSKADERRNSGAGTPPSNHNEGTSSVGYLSNRWNAGNSFSTPSTLGRAGEESFRLDSFPSSIASTADNSPSVLPPPSTSSQSSQVRLSFSLDGKAELVSSQPSPPRSSAPQILSNLDSETLPPVRPNTGRTLQRSRSALPGITLPPISTLTAHLPQVPQLSRGRSRDVHAWESCAESEIDRRDELTKLAESESSGSAVAAISLLRSSSSSASLSSLVHAHAQASQTNSRSNSPGVLQPNPSKRNAPPHGSSATRGGKKPKLGRASSSVARMQSMPPALTAAAVAAAALEQGSQYSAVAEDVSVTSSSSKTPEPELKPGKASIAVILSPSGDSDKENWSPDEDGQPTRRRRPLPSATSHSGTIGTKSPSRSRMMGAKNPRRVPGRVLGEQERDVASRRLFGAGNRANTAPAGKRGKGGGDAAAVMIFEDGDQRGPLGKMAGRSDAEVEKFMRGEVSPSKRPDMDCVAGLLSLSQGNWR